MKDAKHLWVSVGLFIYLWFQLVITNGIENGFYLVDCCSWLLFVLMVHFGSEFLKLDKKSEVCIRKGQEPENDK